MIDIIDDVIQALGSIEAVGGRVYRHWPKKGLSFPAILVSRVSGSTKLSDADGSEILAQVAYSLDIVCTSQRDLDDIAEEAADIVAGYNLHRTGMMDMYDDQYRTYRTVLTVSGTVDKRGNTFIN